MSGRAQLFLAAVGQQLEKHLGVIGGVHAIPCQGFLEALL